MASAQEARESANSPAESVWKASIRRPAASSSSATRSGVNLHETSVRISSPAANSAVSPSADTGTDWATRERSRISIRWSSSCQYETWSNASRSNSPPSSRLITVSTFLLNAAVRPARVVVGRLERGRVLDQVGAQQQGVGGPHQLGQLGQERRPLRRLEVADGAAQEREHAVLAGRDQAQVGSRSRRPRRAPSGPGRPRSARRRTPPPRTRPRRRARSAPARPSRPWRTAARASWTPCPEPSSTSSRAPSVSSGARRFRISRSERAG